MNHFRSLLLASLTLVVGACSTVRYSADYDRQAAFTQFRTYDWLAATEEEQALLERVNPFLERRLQRAIDRELTERGFVKSSDGEPDFWISVYPVVPGQGEGSTGGETHTYPYRGYGGSRTHVTIGFAVYPYGYWYGYPYFGFSYPYFGYPYRWGYPYYSFRRPHWGYRRYGWHPGFGAGYYSVAGFGYPAVVALDGLRPGTIVVDVTDAQTDEIVWRAWAEGALLEAPPPERLAAYVDEVVGRVMKGFPPSPEAR